MFKSARWRSEKNKIHAVFKLQFHATQVPKLGGDALMISVVPADVGKPTVRLEKAAVRDGSCYWENPVYETVKFIRELKTGKIHERIYHFMVSNGSSKSGLFGEVSIDLANYALATKLSSVSLPLKNAKSEGVLHVSIQRMPENADQRELEESENAKNSSQDKSLKTELSNGHTNGSVQSNLIEDGPFNKTISYNGDVNGNRRASNGSDVTISSSESSSGLDTPRELGLKNNNSDQDHTSFLSSLDHLSVPQKPTSDASTTVYEEHQGSQWEWLGGSAPEVSTDDSSSSPRDTLLIEGSQETSDIMVEKLKTEISSLARLAEVSELELQTLRKQIVKEGKRGQDLLREVGSLKDERDALKEECEKLKAFRKRTDVAKVENRLKFEGGDTRALFEELREELNYEKDLNANLRLQLQKTQESNSELILAVRDLDEMLEQKNMEISGSATSENIKELWETNSKSETEYDEDQKALEELVKDHSNAKEAHLLEQKIMDLYGELEIYKGDKDELEMQMQQLALDYEILTQENHDLSYKLQQSQLQEQLKMQYECSPPYASINELETQVENLENELKKQSKEFSDSLASINELKTHVKGLEEELEKQALGFEADLEALTRAKIEQEQRAIQAEETLRKTRRQNANTAERLQEEFRRLSVQMTSTFEANEKLATKSMTEAHELQLQKFHLEEMLQKAKDELQFAKDHYEANLHEHSSQINSMTNQIEQMQSEIEDKSTRLEYQKKHEEETRGVLSQEILMLRAKIQMLTTENNNLSEEPERRETLEAELKQMKKSMKEAEMLVQRGNLERNEMESVITLLREEAEKTLEELNILRSLKDEKETIVGNLQLELETLKSQCNDLKHSLLEDELEKEKLRKQVFHLKGDLKKKEDAFSSIEKKLNSSNSRATVSDGAKATMRNNKAAPVPRGSKEVASMKDKIKLLEAQIMLKETALETSTNSFLEKEKDLQNKIEELERRLEELNHNSMSSHEFEFPKVTCNMEDVTLNGNVQKEVINTVEKLSSTGCMSNKNASTMSLMKSDDKELEAPAINTNELLKEMSLLKERNESMEGELKDMQERYSEISLKFAEVEGERQQLVMTVRNLKNSKKN
ncbi:intracellular protein transport protein USO1-like [Cornus florida]|uniref:intracellular protein transport protein USO1-like n=1 Tax=Cornus florida TaxID=4283 RepID=UPI0028982048|nr:intracellular protein transport protein USO1-like [Cornus florida]